MFALGLNEILVGFLFVYLFFWDSWNLNSVFHLFQQKSKKSHVSTQHHHELKKLTVCQPGLIVVSVPLVESAYPAAFVQGSSPSWSVCSWLENGVLAASNCFKRKLRHVWKTQCINQCAWDFSSWSGQERILIGKSVPVHGMLFNSCLQSSCVILILILPSSQFLQIKHNNKLKMAIELST